MRDLTKSMFSYGWAMSVFGMQQMMNMLNPRDGMQKTAEAMQNVASAAANELGGTLKGTFRVGDDMQRGMVDMMFGAGMGGMLDPTRWMRMGTDMMQQGASFAGQATQAAGQATQAAGEAASATMASPWGAPSQDGGYSTGSSGNATSGWGGNAGLGSDGSSSGFAPGPAAAGTGGEPAGSFAQDQGWGPMP
jgi:hypothetical protein